MERVSSSVTALQTGTVFLCFLLLVYSHIINLYRHSFNEAVEYRNLITKVRASEDVPVILVANKVDLEQTNRAVDVREGEALADKFNCPFYETSAAHRRHVDDVFHSLVREIRQVEYLSIYKGNSFKIGKGTMMWISSNPRPNGGKCGTTFSKRSDLEGKKYSSK